MTNLTIYTKTLLVLGFQFTDDTMRTLEDVDKDLYLTVTFFRKNPFTLRDLTRRAVLDGLNIPTRSNIEKLPLPHYEFNSDLFVTL